MLLDTRVAKLKSKFLLQHLRTTYTILGGHNALEIGTRSLRSGAAMPLFLINNLTAKIMILKRWSSDAFLDNIRPQVLNWTNIMMSRDMIHHDPFLMSPTLAEPSKTTPKNRAAVSIRIQSFLPGFASITKEWSQGDPELLFNGTRTKLRELVLDILSRLALDYAKKVSVSLVTLYLLNRVGYGKSHPGLKAMAD